jgi:3' exoribonuclease, RNase T-like
MRYFIDTEFYEDGSTIDLISIGVVCSDGRQFYACSQDAQLHRVSNWVRENVLSQLPRYSDSAWMPRREIAARLTDLIQPAAGAKRAEVWAYYADYDWVALCQLFGTMMDLPHHFPMFCMDLKQLSVMKGNPTHPKQEGGEHDALADAVWNSHLYDFLVGLP